LEALFIFGKKARFSATHKRNIPPLTSKQRQRVQIKPFDKSDGAAAPEGERAIDSYKS
jgi:hypothetical protein